LHNTAVTASEKWLPFSFTFPSNSPSNYLAHSQFFTFSKNESN
jgi:hypothetical protein